MPVQPQLFPEPQQPEVHPSEALAATPPVKTAPLWLQRLSLFILVLFCVYLGVLVTVLPWWIRVWDQNLFILSHPRLSAVLHLGAVRGFISGLGMLDIWIGISEAVHYRDHRA
jgi:hypothetical protein